MLRPKAHIRSALEISPAWLQERGIKGLLLDLDNTLIPYKTYGECPPDLRAWLDNLQQEGIKTVLVSNGSPARVRYWCEKLGLAGFGPAGKPWFGFQRGLRTLGLSPSEAAVVGDQLFTDVLGGNWAGAYTILVPPISSKELGYTQLVRQLERWMLRRWGLQTEALKLNEDSNPKQFNKGSTIEPK